jgi:Raf kinase inhibitor-like YbhB/YbcL family protein
MLENFPEGFGEALLNQRAGMDQVVYNHLHAERETLRIAVNSPAFVFNGALPRRCTADGEGLSPALSWSDYPPGTSSIAIIVEDADSPTPHPLVHAIAVDLAPDIRVLPEGGLNADHTPGQSYELGNNSYFQPTWLPPDPPPGHGEHRYVFQLFALRSGPAFSASVGRKEFIQVILDRAIGMGGLIGLYERGARKPINLAGERPGPTLSTA